MSIRECEKALVLELIILVLFARGARFTSTSSVPVSSTGSRFPLDVSTLQHDSNICASLCDNGEKRRLDVEEQVLNMGRLIQVGWIQGPEPSKRFALELVCTTLGLPRVSPP